MSYSRGHPDPGTEPASLASPALAGRFFTIVPPGKPRRLVRHSEFIAYIIFTTAICCYAYFADEKSEIEGR